MKKIVKLLIALLIIGSAAFLGYNKYKDYIENPWTRDGQVRTQVVEIAPRIKGMVKKIHVIDNQAVKKGDLLFEIDDEQYKIKLEKAKAKLQRSKENLRGKEIEYARVKKIYARDKGAVSQKEYSQKEVAYLKALSDLDSAKESYNSAKVNLSYTKIYAELDGYVSNISFQIGSQAVANRAMLALVDTSSFWVFGFFRESAIPKVEIGDSAIVTLLAYPDIPLEGRVESIAWGIAPTDGNPGQNLLPKVNPVFHWIRLAQRIPVRIKLSNIPENVKLRFGMTASVMVKRSENFVRE